MCSRDEAFQCLFGDGWHACKHGGWRSAGCHQVMPEPVGHVAECVWLIVCWTRSFVDCLTAASAIEVWHQVCGDCWLYAFFFLSSCILSFHLISSHCVISSHLLISSRLRSGTPSRCTARVEAVQLPWGI